MRCSVLQCVSVCCSVLQCGDRGRTHFCVAVCCSVLQCVAVCCSVLQCVLHYVAVCCSMCCSTLQCVAVCCSVLQCHGTFVLQVAVMALSCCRLQCVAVCRSVLLSSVVAARLILRSLLRGQTVRGLTTQKNPATLEQPRKYGHRSTLRSKEIWPQGCERPNGSRSARLSRVSDMGWLRLVGSLKL